MADDYLRSMGVPPCPRCQLIIEHDPECPYAGLSMGDAARRYARDRKRDEPGAEADDGGRSEQ
jgi:hypothetical protein